MIFTPRLLTSIWNTLSQSLTFKGNPDAPSVEQFVAHYTSPGADPGFSWSDRATGLTYLYDLTINQMQVVPAAKSQPLEVYDANVSLWRLLPPALLEENFDWSSLWIQGLQDRPAYRPNVKILRLVLEQGVDVKPFMKPADWATIWVNRWPYEPPDDWAKLWVKAANAPLKAFGTDPRDVPDLDLMRFVMEQGVDVHAVMQPADWARMWERVAAIPQPETMRFVVEEGFGIRQPGDWVRIWEQAVRAVDETTLRFVLKQGFDARALMQPADWAGLWVKAVASGNVWVMRLILEQGMSFDALMPPADLRKVWFGANEAMTKLFLEYGYDVNTRDGLGRTALDYAPPRPEVVHVLVEAGITLENVPAIIAREREHTNWGDKAEVMDFNAICGCLERAVAAAEAKRLAGGAGTPPAA